MRHYNPYAEHYVAQAGSGLSDVYRGPVFQRGHGFFGQMFRRFGVPVLKYLGKRALSAGSAIASDVLAGGDVKESAARRAREAGTSILQDAAQKIQSGSGARKRKAPKRKRQSLPRRGRTKKSRKSEDIFT